MITLRWQMKRIVIIFLVLIALLACTISFPDGSFDEKISTQVALALTATALEQEVNHQVQETVSADTQPDDGPAPTETTPPADDPKKDLGQPTWKDDLSTGQYWSLQSGPIEIETTTCSLANGNLSAKSAAIGKGNIWWLTYLTFQDAYLEATFNIDDCSGDDQYGLVFRASDYESGFSYYFHVTCDGHYDVRRLIGSGSSMLLGMPASDIINKGSNQTNILGVWVNGPIIRLYLNNHFIKEINDSSLTNEGHFGIFINARKTPGLTVNLDEISYWTLP
jgi:hypothetical protein